MRGLAHFRKQGRQEGSSQYDSIDFVQLRVEDNLTIKIQYTAVKHNSILFTAISYIFRLVIKS